MKSRRRHSLVSMTLLVWSIGVAATGCATGASETRHGIGVGQWQVSMPTTPSPINELAYGRGGSSRPADDALADLDVVQPNEVLQTATAPIAKAKSTPAPRRALAVALAKTEEQQPEPAVLTAPEPTQSVLLASNDADSRYAQRETQSKDQQKFRGGDAIVISAGAIVIVLLIVVLVLLLR